MRPVYPLPKLLMTISLKTSGWCDPESRAAWFLGIVGVLALTLTQLPPYCVPRCMLKFSTGVPCFTCGGFRALQHLLAGHVAGAWRMQPLLTCLAGLAFVWAGYAITGPLFGFYRLRVQTTRRERVLLIVGAALLVLVNWAYLLAAGV